MFPEYGLCLGADSHSIWGNGSGRASWSEARVLRLTGTTRNQGELIRLIAETTTLARVEGRSGPISGR